MSSCRCRYCQLGLLTSGGGSPLGVCPHGDAHTHCCLAALEARHARGDAAADLSVGFLL